MARGGARPGAGRPAGKSPNTSPPATRARARARDERFVTAQAPVFETVLAELRAGRKRSHWIWFIFPQLAG
jgi:hypothetical protein